MGAPMGTIGYISQQGAYCVGIEAGGGCAPDGVPNLPARPFALQVASFTNSPILSMG